MSDATNAVVVTALTERHQRHFRFRPVRIFNFVIWWQAWLTAPRVHVRFLPIPPASLATATRTAREREQFGRQISAC